jgi:hypothetical protein
MNFTFGVVAVVLPGATVAATMRGVWFRVSRAFSAAG